MAQLLYRRTSAIFSLARNFRLQSSIYKYKDAKSWDFKNIFHFAPDVQDLILDGSERNYKTAAIQNFVPDEVETLFGSGTACQQRMMFYCQHYDFTNSEL